VLWVVLVVVSWLCPIELPEDDGLLALDPWLPVLDGLALVSWLLEGLLLEGLVAAGLLLCPDVLAPAD
jgi:hypothetical protein